MAHPVAEVPLCGHATLAAAYVLKSELGVTDIYCVFKPAFGEAFSQMRKPMASPICSSVMSAHDVEGAVERIKAKWFRAWPVGDPWQVIL